MNSSEFLYDSLSGDDWMRADEKESSLCLCCDAFCGCICEGEYSPPAADGSKGQRERHKSLMPPRKNSIQRTNSLGSSAPCPPRLTQSVLAAHNTLLRREAIAQGKWPPPLRITACHVQLDQPSCPSPPLLRRHATWPGAEEEKTLFDKLGWGKPRG
jgi:hypothetical protein